MVDCSVHLISLHQGRSQDEIVSQFVSTEGNDGSNVLVTGVPHGWIHKPQTHDVEILLRHDWHVFILTTALTNAPQLDGDVVAHLAVDVKISREQWKQLVEQRSTISALPSNTPRLPEEWNDSGNGELCIPAQYNADQMMEGTATAGRLKLDASMTNFLSEALPKKVRQQPVSLFNLFKYREGDSSVHDQYMRDFADSFGNSAGARVKFMGPVSSGIRDGEQSEEQGSKKVWQDANLVQYDSIYHYAYMLSTDVYQKLNKDKVRGLEDTCIMVLSEIEMFSGA